MDLSKSVVLNWRGSHDIGEEKEIFKDTNFSENV